MGSGLQSHVEPARQVWAPGPRFAPRMAQGLEVQAPHQHRCPQHRYPEARSRLARAARKLRNVDQLCLHCCCCSPSAFACSDLLVPVRIQLKPQDEALLASLFVHPLLQFPATWHHSYPKHLGPLKLMLKLLSLLWVAPRPLALLQMELF